MASPQQLALAIEGMHCGACVRRVTGALENLPGVRVQSVEIGSAAVHYDPDRIAPPAIASAIDRIGFKATPKP